MYTEEHFEVVFDRPYATIYWDSLNNIVIAEWKGFAMGKDVREVLDTGLAYAIEKDAKRWLADTRKLGVPNPPDEKWIFNDWFPRVLAAGIKEMAFVQPERKLTEMNFQRNLKKSKTDEMQQGYFATVEEAHEWLAS